MAPFFPLLLKISFNCKFLVILRYFLIINYVTALNSLFPLFEEIFVV